MKKIDIINAMLGSVGELPVNDLQDEENELLVAANNILNLQMRSEQAVGWWYNVENVTLLLERASGRIRISPDIVRVRTDKRRYAIRGQALYDLDRGEYVQDEKVQAEIVRVLPIEELPEIAAILVEKAAVLRFQRAYDADESKTRLLMADYQGALADCKAEHTRNVRAKPLNSPYHLRVKNFIGRRGWM